MKNNLLKTLKRFFGGKKVKEPEHSIEKIEELERIYGMTTEEALIGKGKEELPQSVRDDWYSHYRTVLIFIK